jgi:hypothetical protein
VDKIRLYVGIGMAFVVMTLAYLLMRARDKIVDLEAAKIKDKLNKDIADKRRKADESETSYHDAVKRFNDLLKQYRSGK